MANRQMVILSIGLLSAICTLFGNQANSETYLISNTPEYSGAMFIDSDNVQVDGNEAWALLTIVYNGPIISKMGGTKQMQLLEAFDCTSGKATAIHRTIFDTAGQIIAATGPDADSRRAEDTWLNDALVFSCRSRSDWQEEIRSGRYRMLPPGADVVEVAAAAFKKSETSPK